MDAFELMTKDWNKIDPELFRDEIILNHGWVQNWGRERGTLSPSFDMFIIKYLDKDGNLNHDCMARGYINMEEIERKMKRRGY